jgi:hypothetical protein
MGMLDFITNKLAVQTIKGMKSKPAANDPSGPSDPELAQTLGKAKPLWDHLVGHLEAEYAPVTRRWTFSRPTSTWWLRLIRKKRTILYLSPRPRHFVTALVFGAKATAVVLSSEVPEAVKRALNEARAYAEGRGIRLETRTDEDVAVMQKLAAIKMAH